jgi:hypothetical protein
MNGATQMSSIGKTVSAAAVVAVLAFFVTHPQSTTTPPVDPAPSTTVVPGVWWHSGGIACYSSIPNRHGYTTVTDPDSTTPTTLINSDYGRAMKAHVVADHGDEVVVECVTTGQEHYFTTEAACLARQAADDAAELKQMEADHKKYDLGQ